MHSGDKRGQSPFLHFRNGDCPLFVSPAWPLLDATLCLPYFLGAFPCNSSGSLSERFYEEPFGHGAFFDWKEELFSG